MQEFIVDLHVQESKEEVNLDEVLKTLDLSTAQGDESTDYASEEFKIPKHDTCPPILIMVTLAPLHPLNQI